MRAAVLAAMLVGSAPAVAAAQADQAAADARAREIFENGVQLYEEGRYDLAVEAFAEAYRLSRRPALLWNLANAHEKLDQLEEALDALQRYRVYAEAGEREDVAARVRDLQRRIAERQSAAFEDPEDDGGDDGEDDEAAGDDLLLDRGRPEAPGGARSAGPHPAGGVLLGVGGATAGAFAAVAGVTYGQAQDARALGDQAGWEAVKPLNNASLGLIGVGVGTAAAGAVVWVIEAAGKGKPVAAAPTLVFDGDAVRVGFGGRW
jgi:tetratricopeptide (TPR) repeat protein